MITVMTLVLSTISYSYYENWYRKLSTSQVFRLFAGLATVNGLVFLMFLKCPIVRDTIDDYYYNQGKVPDVSFLKKARERELRAALLHTGRNTYSALGDERILENERRIRQALS